MGASWAPSRRDQGPSEPRGSRKAWSGWADFRATGASVTLFTLNRSQSTWTSWESTIWRSTHEQGRGEKRNDNLPSQRARKQPSGSQSWSPSAAAVLQPGWGRGGVDTHTHMHTDTHTDTGTHRDTCTHRETHMYRDTHVGTHVHPDVHAHTRGQTCTSPSCTAEGTLHKPHSFRPPFLDTEDLLSGPAWWPGSLPSSLSCSDALPPQLPPRSLPPSPPDAQSLRGVVTAPAPCHRSLSVLGVFPVT